MPTLPQPYTADLGAAPINGGRRATAADYGDGQGLIDAGHAVQAGAKELQTSAEESESRKVMVAGAEIRAKYSKLLDDAAISGADTAPLKEQLANDLSKVGEGLTTRKGVDHLAYYTATSNQMFDTAANHIAVVKAVAEARVDASKFLNAEGATVMRNPAYLAAATENAKAFAQTLTRVPVEKRAEIEKMLVQELNQGAAFAATKADPEDAKKRLQAGEWDLSPDGRRAAEQGAESEIRGQRADKEYQRMESVRADHALVDTARGKFMDDIIKGKASWAQIRDSEAFNGVKTPEGIAAAANAKKEMFLFMDARNREMQGQAKKSDPFTKQQLWLNSYGPVGDKPQAYDTTDIVAAVAAGKINTDDANQLVAIRTGAKSEDGQRFASRLGQRMQVIQSNMRASPVYANQPDLSNNIQIELMRRAEDRSAELRKAGKNPSDMFNPESKDFFFTDGIINNVAADVKAKTQASLPKPSPIKSPAEILSMDNGMPVTDPKGRVFIVTEEGKKKVRDEIAAGGAYTPSGDTKEAWRLATGGTLKGGQTEEQAYQEWLKARK